VNLQKEQPYKTESKLRSLIKSFTWRIVAIIDTVLVVMAVTCYSDNCSLEEAFAIGLFEFGFKFVVYYLHERVWQRIDMSHRTAKVRTLYKTISWRVVATIMTFIIAGAILDNANDLALTIALIEVITKTVFYYIHERMWLVLPLGRILKFIKK
jgi:uncharacterized membrane protein